MKLSIVTTLYQSEAYIDEFYQRASAIAKKVVGDEYEIIFVNDGSPDNGLDLAIELAGTDSHLTVIDLSRNFGHHKAMMTGLAHAVGEKVFLIDSDLEEQPEWLHDYVQQMEQDSCDMVYGVQEERQGALLSDKLLGALFYRSFRLLTGVEQPNNIVTARLMTQRYVSALIAHKERELNIGGLWIITGFKQSQFLVKKSNSSPTTYSLSHKINHFFNAVTSFSSLPLVFTFYAGLSISLTAAFYILSLVVRYIVVDTIPDGYTSIIASIWLFSGLIIFFLGIQGIYISKLFTESKQRPYTIIKQIHKVSKNS